MPVEARDFSLLKKVQPFQPPIQWLQAFFAEIKRPGHKANH